MNATVASLGKSEVHYSPLCFISAIETQSEYKGGKETGKVYELVSVTCMGGSFKVRIAPSCAAPLNVGDVGEVYLDFRLVDNGYRLWERDGQKNYRSEPMFIPYSILDFKPRVLK